MKAADFQAQYAKKTKGVSVVTKTEKSRQNTANAEIKALPTTAMEQQLHTSEIMDAVACFSMGNKFIYCEYDINQIIAIHQSGVTVTITFK